MSGLTMYQIEAEVMDDGMLLLTQNDCGESIDVCMHLSQLAIIADRFLPHTKPQTDDARAFVLEEHARVLQLLGDEIDELRDDKHGYLDEIISRCGSGLEIVLKIRNIADLAFSLERDLLVLMPKREDTVTQKTNAGERNATSVTRVTATADNNPSSPKTNAERQKSYRERKAAGKTVQLALSPSGEDQPATPKPN